jgi:hypothetical protein
VPDLLLAPHECDTHALWPHLLRTVPVYGSEIYYEARSDDDGGRGSQVRFFIFICSCLWNSAFNGNAVPASDEAVVLDRISTWNVQLTVPLPQLSSLPRADPWLGR